MRETSHPGNGRSLADVVSEIKNEFVDFVRTRAAMAASEIRENMKWMGSSARYLLAGMVLLVTAYMLLTIAVVTLVAAAFWDNTYHWFLGFAAVGLLWAILGAVLTYLAVRQFRNRGLLPRRTIEVLKNDKVWLQHEASNQV